MAGSVMPVTVRCYLELLACFGLCWVGVMAGRPDEMEVFLKVPCSPETVLCDSPLSRVDHTPETGNADPCQASGLAAHSCLSRPGSHLC